MKKSPPRSSEETVLVESTDVGVTKLTEMAVHLECEALAFFTCLPGSQFG